MKRLLFCAVLAVASIASARSEELPPWIADYIRQFAPPGRKPEIDYALITPFHTDHMGTLTEESPPSANGSYRLTGITEVADLLPTRAAG